MALSKHLDGIEYHILYDTRASGSFMSKCNYHRKKSLHDLPKFSNMIRIILFEMVNSAVYYL